MKCLAATAFLVLSVSALAAPDKPKPLPSPVPAAQPTPSGQVSVTARSRALELAGAFANDGYKLRDGHWLSSLEPGKPIFLEVNLYAGNEYWFSGAAVPPARKVSVALFDEQGAPVASESYEDGPVAAAGIIAGTSGKYFVRVELTEGEKSDFCLLYSYK